VEEPQRKSLEAQTVAYIEHIGPYDQISHVYHKLFAWAQEAKVEPAGPAFTVFLEPPDQLDWASGRFEVCLPVPEGTEGSGEVQVKTLPPTEVLSVVVEGPYREMPAHYSELLAWLSVEGTSPAGPPREVYLVHPGSPQPQVLKTEIQFPVKSQE